MAGQDNQSQASDEQTAAPRPMPSLDWHLQTLVDMANRHGVEMGVTLTIGGSTVTGTLVGGKKYFEKFGEMVASGWPGTDEDRERMRATFAEPAKLYEDGNMERPSFIHLRDAQIVHPNEFIPSQGMLWRGRLSDVSGFSLGTFSRS
jgi:hypothetical protein